MSDVVLEKRNVSATSASPLIMHTRFDLAASRRFPRHCVRPTVSESSSPRLQSEGVADKRTRQSLYIEVVLVPIGAAMVKVQITDSCRPAQWFSKLLLGHTRVRPYWNTAMCAQTVSIHAQLSADRGIPC